jgi:predicted TIM-barrel fold metal-dependent hydrolase
VYDIEAAVKEMHRGLAMGLLGAMVWQVPDPQLPFSSRHYDPLWAAAAEAGAPVHMHILTGHSYALTQKKSVGAEKIRGAVNKKQNDTINALFDLIFSGVFERHPKLRVVLAESECGWLPFQDNLMWSNDYPHFNMTFPYSRENVLHHIGNLPKGLQNKLIRGNAIRLYGLASRLEEQDADALEPPR